MATETTLGRRLFDAAADYDIYGESGYGAGDRLRALCARADAAERGMVAFAKEVTAGNMHTLVDERREALAAWRAITEGVQP